MTNPRSEATIDRILATARQLFLDHPYADVSVDRIAKATEVTKGGIYHHFDSKEELYLAMLHADFERLSALFEEAAAVASTCREKLGLLTRAFLTLPPLERRVMQLVRRDLNTFEEPTRTDLIRGYQRALPERIERVLREGIDRGELRACDPRLLSWGFVALVEVALTPYSDTVFEDVDEKLDFVLDQFFHGAAPPSEVTSHRHRPAER